MLKRLCRELLVLQGRHLYEKVVLAMKRRDARASICMEMVRRGSREVARLLAW